MMGNKNYWSSLWLSLIIFAAFIFQQLIFSFTDMLILGTDAVSTRPWTLITSIFLHSSIVHLLYNLLGLALFGIILEDILGTRKFLKLFFIAGLAASFASLPFYGQVLGASGAIFGIIGALAILRPKMAIWLYGMPMPMFIALIIWAAIDIFGIFFPQGTANISHLAGLAAGIIAGIINYGEHKEQKPKKESITIDEEKVKEWERQF